MKEEFKYYREHLEEYFEAQKEYLSLVLVERTSKILAKTMTQFILWGLIGLIAVFGIVLVTLLLEEWLGNLKYAIATMMGILVVKFLLIYAFRVNLRRPIRNMIIASLTNLLEDDED